ncbi:hypothetical protein E2542_SST29940 [Spatholobus suberectus]|nr:hypothetical protein E2542_SST29940 [Spatholobus suberectus]
MGLYLMSRKNINKTKRVSPPFWNVHEQRKKKKGKRARVERRRGDAVVELVQSAVSFVAVRRVARGDCVHQMATGKGACRRHCDRETPLRCTNAAVAATWRHRPNANGSGHVFTFLLDLCFSSFGLCLY